MKPASSSTIQATGLVAPQSVVQATGLPHPPAATEPVAPHELPPPNQSFYDSIRYFNPLAEITNIQRNLPHWRQPGVTYFVTFRLADSLPTEKLNELKAVLNQVPDEETHAAFIPQLELWLDAGHGECLLKRPDLAQIVADCLRHFDGQRYELLAWVIMPNHVHVLVRSLKEFNISQVLHTWKSFTAHEINQALHRSGPVWQHETYDPIVRHPNALWAIADYIMKNPARAGITTPFLESRVPNT